MASLHPYDDPHAYHRAWDRLDPAELSRAADRDPLLFIADHIALADRREGSLAVHVGTDDGGTQIVVIADAEPDPDEDTCVAVLATIVERLGADRVTALGVVHHRRGRAHIDDLDRRWQRSLGAVCHHYAIGDIGVLARIESGAIVRLSSTSSATR